MGFLDHSTNNIILDSVLTDDGRKFLAGNDGSFSIQKFALGDDEVNYNIISKYGRTVGKEKIEKNTPIFEALTNASVAQKYKLVSVSNPNLIYLPNLALVGGQTVSLSPKSGNSSGKATVQIQQDFGAGTPDVELLDQTFVVQVPNLFLQISNQTPENISGQQVASYLLTRNANLTSAGGTTLNFELVVKSISSTMFTVYGTSTNKSVIKTYVKVTGVQSGAVIDIQVLINS